MKVPLGLSFHGVDEDIDRAEIRALIDEKIQKLESVCSYMISCHVAIEQPQRHQKSGISYRVRIDVRIPPNHEIVVRKDPHKGDLHDPLPKIIREAFTAVRRQLKEQVNIQHRKVKSHTKGEVKFLPDEVEDIA